MELSLDYHPSEILRRIELTWLEFWNDQDFRHPELRHRLALELNFRAKQLELDGETKSLLEPLLEEFDRSEERVSFVEFWLLLEWNERYLQVAMLLEIAQLLTQDSSWDPTIAQDLHGRLHEIHHELLTVKLGRDPTWISLLKFRWRNAGLRDEVRYFRSLLSANPDK